jgi:hypothetical protein
MDSLIHRFDEIAENIHSFSHSEREESRKCIESFIKNKISFQFIESIFQFSKTEMILLIGLKIISKLILDDRDSIQKF